MVPSKLQSTFITVAVTFGMFFHGKSKRICSGYKGQLERYSHIQWECTGLMSKVDEVEIVDVIRGQGSN